MQFDFVMASATSVLTIDVWDTLNWLEGRFSLKGLTGARRIPASLLAPCAALHARSCCGVHCLRAVPRLSAHAVSTAQVSQLLCYVSGMPGCTLEALQRVLWGRDRGMHAHRLTTECAHMLARPGRKETKQRIGTLRLPVAEVVRNGKIRDTWALQDTQKGDIALGLVVRQPRRPLMTNTRLNTSHPSRCPEWPHCASAQVAAMQLAAAWMMALRARPAAHAPVSDRAGKMPHAPLSQWETLGGRGMAPPAAWVWCCHALWGPLKGKARSLQWTTVQLDAESDIKRAHEESNEEEDKDKVQHHSHLLSMP